MVLFRDLHRIAADGYRHHSMDYLLDVIYNGSKNESIQQRVDEQLRADKWILKASTELVDRYFLSLPTQERTEYEVLNDVHPMLSRFPVDFLLFKCVYGKQPIPFEKAGEIRERP